MTDPEIIWLLPKFVLGDHWLDKVFQINVWPSFGGTTEIGLFLNPTTVWELNVPIKSPPKEALANNGFHWYPSHTILCPGSGWAGLNGLPPMPKTCVADGGPLTSPLKLLRPPPPPP